MKFFFFILFCFEPLWLQFAPGHADMFMIFRKQISHTADILRDSLLFIIIIIVCRGVIYHFVATSPVFGIM